MIRSSRPTFPFSVVAALVTLAMLTTPTLGAPPPSRGERLYRERCALCHPIDHGTAQGPGLGDIVGRRAGSLAGFGYSPALRASRVTWSRATLDRFLADPAAMIPGTLMPIPTPDLAERSALLAYLTTLRSTAKAQPPLLKRPPNNEQRAPASPDPRVVLRGAAAFGDFRADAPGVTRHITAADIPRPYASRSSRNGPEVVARPAGATLRVPVGFSISAFAQLEHPRLLRTAPNGDLFVAESLAGKIVVVRPQGDGAEAPQLFAAGLDRPFGIAFWPPGPQPRYVYVAENGRVVRFAYATGELHARGQPEVIVAKLTDGSEGHWTRDLAFSPDGKRMYVSIGSASNVAEGQEEKDGGALAAWERREGLGAGWGAETHRADVMVFDEQGHDGRVFASGIRNCVGMAVDARGSLWCATNERDGLGDDLVPDYVTRVREGAFYGWPWYYLGDHEDPRHPGARPDLRGKVTVPEVLLQAHSAALQPAIYDGAQFPSDYRGDLFVALHGSWNRSGRTGYKVIRVRTSDGAPTGEYQDFVTGFVVDDDHVWGRPVGVAVAADGSLYVGEDGNGLIWRVRHASTPR